jgi:hypothetical protein
VGCAARLTSNSSLGQGQLGGFAGAALSADLCGVLVDAKVCLRPPERLS